METSYYVETDNRKLRYISVEIIDNGPGFDDEVAAHLFTPFFSRAEGGHGLGLSIARNIAISHDGRIQAENARERRLPVSEFPCPWRESGTTENEWLIKQEKFSSSTTSKTFATSSPQRLSEDGHEWSRCGDAERGAAGAVGLGFHLAFVDINLPGMSGFDLLDRYVGERRRHGHRDHHRPGDRRQRDRGHPPRRLRLRNEALRPRHAALCSAAKSSSATRCRRSSAS